MQHLPNLPSGAWLGLNLSAQALLGPDVQATVLAHADHRIGIELTEHTPTDDYVQLRAAGVQLVVDDAVVGSAGPHDILQLRSDTIKLDIALVRGIDSDSIRTALTRCVSMDN